MNPGGTVVAASRLQLYLVGQQLGREKTGEHPSTCSSQSCSTQALLLRMQ